MIKKIQKFITISFLIFSLSFSTVLAKEISESSVTENFEIRTVGPTSAPNIKGPTSPPPTVEQINLMKKKAGHEEFILKEEKSFIETFINWVSSLF